MAKGKIQQKMNQNSSSDRGSRIGELESQLDAARSRIQDQDKMIEELKYQLGTYENVPAQLIPPAEHSLSIVQQYDPILLGSLVAVLKDPMNGYPLQDQEFNQIAPKFVDQALTLYGMFEQATREIRGMDGGSDTDSEIEPPRKGGPVLP